MTQNEQDENAHDQITKQVSASRHTPEPWHASHHGDSVIIASESGWVSSYFKQQADMDRAVSCVNALAGMNPEAVKDVVGLLSEIEQLLVMDAPQPPWIPGGRAKGLPERIRAALAALKESK